MGLPSEASSDVSGSVDVVQTFSVKIKVGQAIKMAKCTLVCGTVKRCSEKSISSYGRWIGFDFDFNNFDEIMSPQRAYNEMRLQSTS